MSTFGLNAAYINDLYYEYLRNPSSFDARWREFFATYDPEAESPSAPATTQATTDGHNSGRAQPNAQPPSPAPSPAAPAPPQQRPAAEAAAAPEGGRELRSSALRLAQNMEQSLTIPTATTFREIPVKLLEENRTLINGYLKGLDQGKLSFTHLIGWAIVRALREFPSLNNGFVEKDGRAWLLERADVNLGIAIDVARPDGSRSLVVPCIKGANAMEFRAFYDRYEDLVSRARVGKLSPDDFFGTTVTLTNPGTIGTVASVPRLMMGQGTIIATGAIGYPAAWQATDPETLSDLGVSKIMQITSTYDHRIIQGAESGMFLARVQDLLMGQGGFYDEVFRSLRIAFRPLTWERSTRRGDRSEHIEKQQAVIRLIRSFRVRGHRQAHLDPLGEEPAYDAELDPAQYGLSIWDFDHTFMTTGLAGLDRADLRTILSVLRDTYTQRVGVEYMHIQDLEQRDWLRAQMETTRNQPKLTADERKRILRKLNEAEVFEKFLQTKYTGHKRFSLEGSETMIPMLDELVRRAVAGGVREVFIGMAHRGRLNVLANIIGKNAERIFAEFEDILLDPNSVLGSGDVKYHLGDRGAITMDDGERVEIWLAPNPSHLEAVDPVVEGMARARQDRIGPGGTEAVLPVLIHGDAAFAGQGVVAETLNLSQLEGYTTGGTIHIVVNNQIGFTAAPADTRSGIYATDVARMVQAPIFHVNGDDPEAAIHVMRLALDYRNRYRRDAVVDLFCFRRHGHNETDEPGFTNPILYRRIRQHPPIHVVYMQRLVRNGTMTAAEAEANEADLRTRLEALLAATRSHRPPQPVADPLADVPVNPEQTWSAPQTGAPIFMLEHVAQRLSTIPEGLQVHPKLVRHVQGRAQEIADGKISWALAEALAIGTLLLEGRPVRLSGQDSRRGTFSQRHAMLRDQQSGTGYVPLDNLSETQARFYVYDSPLSEYAVLGFEYGYSVTDPGALVLWEAQFGDFVNGGQIIIDQFLSSGEDKWGQQSSLALLLPHGFEGQGPEHSSARLERFLNVCAEDNMVIAYPSTAGQYFHLLRLQARREPRKPLVVLTPKSLLRDPLVTCRVEDLTGGGFRDVIGEIDQIDPVRVRRLVLCSGKIYYDLLKARRESNADDIGIIRIEKLYPFPAEALTRQLETYRSAREVLWVQEEPKNMGAWPMLSHWIEPLLRSGQKLGFLGRPASGSPAAGSGRRHNQEQAEIIRRAIGLADDTRVEQARPAGSSLPES